jgi:hypothetical protein
MSTDARRGGDVGRGLTMSNAGRLAVGEVRERDRTRSWEGAARSHFLASSTK